MIQGIGTTNYTYMNNQDVTNKQKVTNNQDTTNTKQYDVHNMSLNEAGEIAREMYNKGEISLREMLSFIPPLTPQIKSDLEKEFGHEISLKYYGDLWDNPNEKRDLLSTFQSILEAKKKDHEMTNSTEFAINFLENLKNQKDEKKEGSSFEDFLYT